MDYPGSFDTPAFPAGKRIAVSRFMAIGISAMFFLIIFACGLLIWSVRSQRVDPFLISINNLTGQWSIVGHPHGQLQHNAMRTMQESVVGNFAADWFTISSDADENTAMWQTCDRDEYCQTDDILTYGDKTCALYCAAGEDIFSRFIYNVVPDYQNRAAAGERITLNMETIQIEPMGQVNENGGTWRLTATVQSNLSGETNIIAFAKVARDTKFYPRTLGFYVADFNAYNIN